MRSLISRRLVTSLAAAGLLAAGAVGAFAANADLPDQASDNAKSKVVERPTDDTGTGDTLTGDLTTKENGESNHGQMVSTFAHETELEGCARGQAVAAVARGDLTPEEAETADFSEKCDRGDDEDALLTTEGDEDDGAHGKGAEVSGEHRGGHGSESGKATADDRSGGKRGGPHTDED